MRNEPEGFSEFWSIWLQIKRRNDGKGDARDGFAKMVKAGADPQDIVHGARRYARGVPAEDPYVPMAKTWINREVWADLCEDERKYQQQLQQQDSQNVVSMPQGPRGDTAFLRQWEKQRSRA